MIPNRLTLTFFCREFMYTLYSAILKSEPLAKLLKEAHQFILDAGTDYVVVPYDSAQGTSVG